MAGTDKSLSNLNVTMENTLLALNLVKHYSSLNGFQAFILHLIKWLENMDEFYGMCFIARVFIYPKNHFLPLPFF